MYISVLHFLFAPGGDAGRVVVSFEVVLARLVYWDVLEGPKEIKTVVGKQRDVAKSDGNGAGDDISKQQLRI